MTLQETIKKARYGHNDWIIWADKTLVRHAERKSPAVVKRCLLDCGTQGRWLLITANEGTPIGGCWWLGINLLAHMRHGY